MATIIPVNGSDRAWARHRFILWFGACAPTYLMIWANSLDDALETAGDWIAANAPGLFCDDAVGEEYRAAIADGLSEEEATTRAEQDTTSLDGGHYLVSWEWGILAEDPTREQVLALLAGP